MQDISHLMGKPECVMAAVPRKLSSGTGKPNALTIRTTGFKPISPNLTSSADAAGPDARPAWIQRRPDLGDIPPSPPVMDPAYLLDNGYTSPDITATMSPLLPMTMSPLGKRAGTIRRPSGLAREMQSMHVDDVFGRDE